jgi:TPR repeat protein
MIQRHLKRKNFETQLQKAFPQYGGKHRSNYEGLKKMKRLIQTFLILVSLVGCSSQFNEGMDALKQKDYKVAFDKWKPLAEQEHDDAQYKIGKLYREGLGVELDYVEAYKWYYIVAKKGYGGCNRYMKKIRRDINPAQVSRAEKLSGSG